MWVDLWLAPGLPSSPILRLKSSVLLPDYPPIDLVVLVFGIE
jgi:hypothetical protein